MYYIITVNYRMSGHGILNRAGNVLRANIFGVC